MGSQIHAGKRNKYCKHIKQPFPLRFFLGKNNCHGKCDGCVAGGKGKALTSIWPHTTNKGFEHEFDNDKARSSGKSHRSEKPVILLFFAHKQDYRDEKPNNPCRSHTREYQCQRIKNRRMIAPVDNEKELTVQGKNYIHIIVRELHLLMHSLLG